MNAIVQSIRGMGALRLTALAVVIVVLFILFGFLTMRLTTPVMTPIYSNLPVSDASQIVTKLDSMGVRYEIRADGTQVMVPADQVLRLRMAMAQQNLPSRGSIVGYEIFDKTDALGTSNFVHNVNLIRALEGELARTISSFNSIDTARVHLVIPRKELFSKNQTPPSASVVLKLKVSTGLPKEQTAAITHLVATAVPGLDISRITIVDSNGKLLAKGGGSPDDIGTVASNAEEYRVSFENRLRETIETLIEKSVGPGSVKAQVSAEIDFDRVTTSSEIFDPNGQVARSVQVTEERENATEKKSGDVSVSNNLPTGQGQGVQGGGSVSLAEKTGETTNFEISKTVKSQVSETGTIKRISIAVLVDGVYTVNAETNEKTYAPRPDEELDKLKILAKSAVGFNEKRGDTIEVVNMKFTHESHVVPEEKPFDWLKRDFDSILKTIVVGVVAILVILLVIKPLVHRAFEVTSADIEGTPGGATSMPSGGGSVGMAMTDDDDGGINLEQMRNTGSFNTIKKINDFVGGNPEESLAVIRSFMQKT